MSSLLRRRGFRLGAAGVMALLFVIALLCGLSELGPVQAVSEPDPFAGAGGVSAAGGTGVYGGALGYGLLNEPDSLDPITSTPQAIIVSQVFEGLLAFDEDMNLVPAIDTSWSTVDGQTFTFALRSDVWFHNGRSLTAEDVVYAWNRLDPEIISTTAAVNSTTLRVTLDHAEIQWLYELPSARYSVVASETVGTIDDHPVGSGPFRFDSWTAGTAITLTANPDYYGGRPYLDAVVFRFYADQGAMDEAFQNGAIEFRQVADPDIAGLGGDPNLILTHQAQYEWLWMTLSQTPTNQTVVRRALNYAVDRPAVINALSAAVPGHYVQAESLVLPGLQGYAPVLSPTYSYNPSLALALLYSAGYTDTAPGDGILDDGQGKDLTIEVWANSGNTARETAAQTIAQQWMDIGNTGMGISVTTVFTDWGVFLDHVLGARIPSYVIGITGASREPFSQLDLHFRSGAGFNLTRYSDPQVDAWLDQSMATVSVAQRHALYEQIEERVMGEAPVLPLWHKGVGYMKGDCVNGIAVLLNQDIPLEAVYRCEASSVVEPGVDSTLTYTDVGGNTTVFEVPAGAVTETTTLVYRAVETVTHSTGYAFAGRAFELDAYQDEVLVPGLSFAEPVTVTLSYTDADIDGLDESTLVLQYWDEASSAWEDAACGPYDRHPDENWLAVPICHLSRFALFGEPHHRIYLPVVMRSYPQP